MVLTAEQGQFNITSEDTLIGIPIFQIAGQTVVLTYGDDRQPIFVLTGQEVNLSVGEADLEQFEPGVFTIRSCPVNMYITRPVLDHKRKRLKVLETNKEEDEILISAFMLMFKAAEECHY